MTTRLPFTLSTAEWVRDPALFVALHVYSPMWVKSTLEMINMLVLVPTMVVVMLGPEFSFWPLRLHVIVTGMSPLDTTQVNWAKSPESVTGFPNVNGMICGGSKTEKVLFRFHLSQRYFQRLVKCDRCKFTIDFQFSRVSD